MVLLLTQLGEFAQLPLMNVSTLDETFLLFADQHASRALKLLEPHFAVEVED